MWRRRAATWMPLRSVPDRMPPNVYDPTVNMAAFRCTTLPSTRRSRWSSASPTSALTRCLSRARGWTVAAAHCRPAQDLQVHSLLVKCPNALLIKTNQGYAPLPFAAGAAKLGEISRALRFYPGPTCGGARSRTAPTQKGITEGAGKRPRRFAGAIGGGCLAPFFALSTSSSRTAKCAAPPRSASTARQ
jgi:hypothetical protein